MKIFEVKIQSKNPSDMTQQITLKMKIKRAIDSLKDEYQEKGIRIKDTDNGILIEDMKESQNQDEIRKKLMALFDENKYEIYITEKTGEAKAKTGIGDNPFEKDKDAAGEQQSEKDADREKESSEEVERKETAMDKIRQLVGMEDFKHMAQELEALSGHMKKIPGFLQKNTYLFSIDDGYGVTTAGKLFTELAYELQLIPHHNFLELPHLPDVSDPDMIRKLTDAVSKDIEARSEKTVICVDLSECYDALKRSEYKEMLKECSRANKGILIFRVPFMESHMLQTVEDMISDLFYVHTVAFTPFSTEELFECAKRSASQNGCRLDDDMLPIIEEMVAQEKSDGRFYGVKTMDKIVTQLIYEKMQHHAAALTGGYYSDASGEQDWTRITCRDYLHDSHLSVSNDQTAEEQLRKLIGIEEVVRQIDEIIASIEYEKKQGSHRPTLHMRFVGPPGTGKTTVARLFGQMLKEHNILRTGVFFEYTGNDFIAKYVGHTAAKTAQICRDAYGGVLFIDEAYSLAVDHSHESVGSFREEALNTLLAQMENHRDDMVVILAGYENEIDQLMSTNPGLPQRVPYVIHFDKYSKEELAEIFFMQASQRFTIDDEVREHVCSYFKKLPNNIYHAPNFANARFVRNLYERVISKAALRARLEKSSDNALSIIDFEKAVQEIELTMTESMIYGKDASGAVMFSEEDASIHFDDVCGQDEAKELLSEMIDFIKNSAKYTQIGAVIPKGALLYGPPGTGKTMLVKAAAGEAGIPVLTISGADLTSKYVGEGAEKVRALFKQAKKLAPCIVFIDEIDAIGGSRNVSGNDTTLIQLLTEMDGFGNKEQITVLAATNRPEMLDPALKRPGRLDREIPVELPGLTGRMEIMQHYLENTQYEDGIDLKEVANLASGMSGADIKNVVNEAALRAIREKRSSISQRDLEESIEVVAVGYQIKEHILSPKEKEYVCYHEIGHALVTALLTHTAPVKKITVLPRTGGALGYVLRNDEEQRYLRTKTEMENDILISLAGRAAEEVHFHEITGGASNDIEKATYLARLIVARYGMSDELDMVALQHTSSNYLGGGSSISCSDAYAEKIDHAVVELIRKLHQKAIQMLQENEHKLDRLAKTLYEKETITGDEFMQLLSDMK